MASDAAGAQGVGNVSLQFAGVSGWLMHPTTGTGNQLTQQEQKCIRYEVDIKNLSISSQQYGCIVFSFKASNWRLRRNRYYPHKVFIIHLNFNHMFSASCASWQEFHNETHE